MIEDDLRAAMHAHDQDAPAADSFVARPLRRRPTAPIVAAVAVTAAVIAIVAVVWTRPTPSTQTAGRDPQHSSNRATPPQSTPAALACPQAPHPSRRGRNGWVPAKPQTPAPDKALVPHVLPQAVVVCSYTGRFPINGPHADTLVHPRLAGERAVGGNLLSVTDTLSDVPQGQPGACLTNLASTDHEYYLIGVLIDGKRTWVAAPGDHCQGTTNGVFLGRTNLRLEAQQAYEWGRWDSDATLRPQCGVPQAAVGPAKLRADPTRLTVCVHTARSWVVLRAANPGNSAVTTYNTAMAAGPNRCRGTSQLPFAFSARLDYADGTSLFIGGDTSCIGGPDGGVLGGHRVSRVVDAFTREPFGLH